MPFDHTIDYDLRRITVVIRGEYDNEDYRAYIQSTWEGPFGDKILGFDQLCLSDNAIYKGGNAEIAELVEIMRQLNSKNRVGKTALVYLGTSMPKFPSGSLFKDAWDKDPKNTTKLKLFTSITDATAWLDS